MKQIIRNFVQDKHNQALADYIKWENHPSSKNKGIEQCLNFQAGKKKMAEEILEYIKSLNQIEI